MKKLLHWMAWHLGHWALLYLAFVMDLEGAMSLLKFFVWMLAPLSLFFLSAKLAAEVAKKPRQPSWQHACSQVQGWITLCLLVWFGHVATGVAWAIVILMSAFGRDQAEKIRAAAAAS